MGIGVDVDKDVGGCSMLVGTNGSVGFGSAVAVAVGAGIATPQAAN